MQIIPKEEAEKLNFVKSYANRTYGEFTKIVLALEPHQAIKINKEEWKYKSNPSTFIYPVRKKYAPEKQFAVKSLENKEGWVIFRLK